MGFFRSLLNWFNPTRDWEEDLIAPIVLDLDHHLFCGVGIGEPIEKLSFLGPGQVTSLGIAWPRKGVAVANGNGLIDEMSFFFGHVAEQRGGQFVGTFHYRSGAVTLSRDFSEENALCLFGQPYWRDQDQDESILFYELGDRELQLEFGLDRRLKCLVLCLPILADESQRKAYGVTKPWPPRQS